MKFLEVLTNMKAEGKTDFSSVNIDNAESKKEDSGQRGKSSSTLKIAAKLMGNNLQEATPSFPGQSYNLQYRRKVSHFLKC